MRYFSGYTEFTPPQDTLSHCLCCRGLFQRLQQQFRQVPDRQLVLRIARTGDKIFFEFPKQ